MSRTFASLAVPNYRLWFAGALVSNIGTWMQRIAQDWLVLTQLTNHSGTATGIVTGLQFLPVIFISPYAGVIADRVSKLKLLKVTQAVSGLFALVLGLLVLTGTAELWHVYVLATGLGIVTAFDTPPRQAFVNDLVPQRLVPNAVSLNSTSFNAARLAGPGVSGLLIAAIGTGWVFMLNAASFAAVILSLALMKPAGFYGDRPVVQRQRGQIREGLRYVKRSPRLIMMFVMAFVIGTFGMNFQLFMAVMSTTVFHRGPEDYGILGTIMAIGTLAGALAAARRSGGRIKWAVGGALVFGVFTVACAYAPGYVWFAVLLIPTGFASITFLNSANVTVQLGTDPYFRGRVMALYMMLLQGGTPIGAPVVGWIAENWGARWSMAIGGAAAVLVGAWAVFYWLRHDDDRSFHRRLGEVRAQVRERVRHPRHGH